MDQQTIQAYDQYAEQYDQETTDFWSTFPVTMLDTFAALQPSPTLDIGCGPGRDALLLTNRGVTMTCLDASKTMVDICREKGLNALQADLLNLPFAKETFAGVWAYTSLLHVPKK
jgi:ubiquinone/menaquinone biosynthesis C-methylase UbiE